MLPYIKMFCISQDLLKQNEIDVKSILGNAVIISCQKDVFENDYENEEVVYIKALDEFHCYLKEVQERHLKPSQVMVIHREEALLKCFEKEGFQTILIHSSSKYETLSQMLYDWHKRKKKQNLIGMFFFFLAGFQFLISYHLEINWILILGGFISIFISAYFFQFRHLIEIILLFLDAIE